MGSDAMVFSIINFCWNSFHSYVCSEKLMKYEREPYLQPAFDDLMKKDCPLIVDYIANLEMQIENLYELRKQDIDTMDSLRAITSEDALNLVNEYDRLKALVRAMYSHIMESVPYPSNELKFIMNEAMAATISSSNPNC